MAGDQMQDDQVDSAGDDRTVNNAVRHQYRKLSEAEKQQMLAVKDKGAELLALIDEIEGEAGDASLDLELGRIKTKEAVMWTVRHITG